MYNHLRLFTLALAVVLFACHSSSGDLIFSENFGNISDGTNITTSNTNFNYRRIGSGGGGIVSTNPSSFTQAAMSLGGSSSSSLNGVGLTSGLGNNNFLGLSFNFNQPTFPKVTSLSQLALEIDSQITAGLPVLNFSLVSKLTMVHWSIIKPQIGKGLVFH